MSQWQREPGCWGHALKQLERDLRDYQLPDHVQDSVLSLAIALEHAREAQAFRTGGRINTRLLRSLNAPAPVPARLPGATLPWQTISWPLPPLQPPNL